MRETILITGCSSGIGYHTAKTLHEAGYNVIATCRDPIDVHRLKLQGLNSIVLDVTIESSISNAIQHSLQSGNGRIDVLFNNAAYGQCGALEDLPTDALRAQFETNFFGWHRLTKAIIPIMLKQGDGKIIQNSSVLGLVAMKYRGAYNSSKFAIEGYTDTLRLELMDTNISVCLIEPGPIESKFRQNALKMFQKTIDIDNSRHKSSYQNTIQRLSKTSSSNKFTLSADAVTDKVVHILNSDNPKARYYVTKPTYIFGILRRLLSTPMLDRLLVKSD
ncbi:SDR family oxidoreductase [Vibrio gallicus]|uniref:SDR family oxidoreductase n=1 Tax=Vibrio gallicus TaxID=190897 RepID=UPI0021C3F281|nr:SDR family oxidoreductase [Vibrio gallicus]